MKLTEGAFLTQENRDDGDWEKFKSQRRVFSKQTFTKLNQKFSPSIPIHFHFSLTVLFFPHGPSSMQRNTDFKIIISLKSQAQALNVTETCWTSKQARN